MFSFSITRRAEASARTLKPTIIAFEAAAKVASVSVIPPTPEPTTFTFTSSVESSANAWQIASTEP